LADIDGIQELPAHFNVKPVPSSRSPVTPQCVAVRLAALHTETNKPSTTLNISGPTFTSAGGDDVILPGAVIILLFAGVPSNPPGPQILATHGRATIEDGLFNIDTFTGTSQNVCEQLAE